MKRSVFVILIAIVLALPAGAAHALWVRPSTAPLVNAGGGEGGCQASITSETIPSPPEGPYHGSPGWLKLQVDLECTHHWRAYTLRNKWLTVTADGKRGVLFNGGSAQSSSPDDSVPSPEPFSTYLWTSLSPCLMKSDGVEHLPGSSDLPWLLPRGKNKFILGGFAKVNEFKGGPDPYRVEVEQLITVKCTSARAAYR